MDLAVSLQQRARRQEHLADEDFREIVLAQYDREHMALRRYVAYLGLDSDAAHDVVQEAFVRLYEHLSSSGDRTNLRAWLYRVVHNLARNRQGRYDATHSSIDDLTGFSEPADPAASPEQTLIHAEQDTNLREALKSLPPAQRECLVLRAQGLKYREIAETLGLSVSTVGKHIQRGVNALREYV